MDQIKDETELRNDIYESSSVVVLTLFTISTYGRGDLGTGGALGHPPYWEN